MIVPELVSSGHQCSPLPLSWHLNDMITLKQFCSSPLNLSKPFSESDSLHEDRRAGLLPEIEAEEEASKNNPPSNGTVACYHFHQTAKQFFVLCPPMLIVLHKKMYIISRTQCTECYWNPSSTVQNITGTPLQYSITAIVENVIGTPSHSHYREV